MLFFAAADALPRLLPTLLWLAVGLFPAFYLAVLVHEVGHVVVGRLCGYTVTSFGLGTEGPLLLRLLLPGGNRPIFYVLRRNALQGFARLLPPDLYPPPTRTLPVVLGGALANLGAAALCLAAFARRPDLFPLFLLGAANTLVMALALLPMSRPVPGGSGEGDKGVRYPSDGRTALLRLTRRARRTSYSPAVSLRPVPLLIAVGDRLMLAEQHLTAASEAIDLGSGGAAERLLQAARGHLEEAPPSPAARPLLDARLHLEEGRLLLLAGHREAAVAALTEARNRFAAANRPVGRLAAAVALAAATEDRTTLERLAEDPLTAQRPELRLKMQEALLLTCLRAGAAESPEAVETLLARYEAARRRYQDLTADLRVYTALARYRETRGDLGGASVAAARAEEARHTLHTLLSGDPEAQVAVAPPASTAAT